MKDKLFQVDFNIWHYFCNMSCKYCVKHIPFVRDGDIIYIWDEDRKEYMRYTSVSAMVERANVCLQRLFAKYEISILTFSGSEPFLFPEIIQLMSYAAKNVKYVQIITNGSKLNYDLIKTLEQMGENIQISLSLDGNLTESNYARTYENKEALNKILEALEMLIESSLKFDVMSVLSKYNIIYLQDFLEYLERFDRKICVQMWPVFGDSGIGLQTEDSKYISEVLEHYEEYKLKLQPYAYFKKMYQYLTEGKRSVLCFLAKYCIYLNDKGETKLCPCNGVVKMNNIVKENSFEYDLEKYCGVNTIVSLPCKKCYINWDVINLFLADDIKLAEIIEMPLFSNKQVVEALKEMKKNFKEKVYFVQ